MSYLFWGFQVPSYREAVGFVGLSEWRGGFAERPRGPLGAEASSGPPRDRRLSASVTARQG